MVHTEKLAFPHPLPSKRRMDLLLFFHSVFHAQRTEDPIFSRGSPGVALVGLREADLGAACGHSDFYEARHGEAIEGVDPAIGDCDGGNGADAHRGPKEDTRGLRACNGRGESPHLNDKDATIL